MKIETKFGYFSTAYTLLDNKVYSFQVEKIDIYVYPKLDGDKFSQLIFDVNYYDYKCKHVFNERDCFATKEELLASL